MPLAPASLGRPPRTLPSRVAFDEATSSILFLHVPRTGGTSFARRLTTLDTQPPCVAAAASGRKQKEDEHNGHSPVATFTCTCARSSAPATVAAARSISGAVRAQWLVAPPTTGWLSYPHAPARYLQAAFQRRRAAAGEQRRGAEVHLVTMLREPIGRMLSEFRESYDGWEFSFFGLAEERCLSERLFEATFGRRFIDSNGLGAPDPPAPAPLPQRRQDGGHPRGQPLLDELLVDMAPEDWAQLRYISRWDASLHATARRIFHERVRALNVSRAGCAPAIVLSAPARPRAAGTWASDATVFGRQLADAPAAPSTLTAGRCARNASRGVASSSSFSTTSGDDDDSLVVVARHGGANVGWLRNSSRRVLVLDKGPSIPNAGEEGSTYLHYITSHYDALPRWVLFMTAHERHWHHALASQLCSMCVDVASLRRSGIGFLNVNHDRTGRMMLSTRRQPAELDAATHARLRRELLGLPPTADASSSSGGRQAFPPNAQFWVARERIRARPLSYYQRLLGVLSQPSHPLMAPSSWYKKRSLWGFLVEAYWHAILGECELYALPFEDYRELPLRPECRASCHFGPRRKPRRSTSRVRVAGKVG